MNSNLKEDQLWYDELVRRVEDRILELKSESLLILDKQIRFEKLLDKNNPESIYKRRECYDNYESWEKDLEWYETELEFSIPKELSDLNQKIIWLIELLN